LVFSVSRVENHLRKGRYAKRISPTASVYLASVLEYLVSLLSIFISYMFVYYFQVAEISELAGDMTRKSNRKRITPRDIALVIKNDHELVSFYFSRISFPFNELLGETLCRCDDSRRWCSTIYS
jgi:histone H3/H4